MKAVTRLLCLLLFVFNVTAATYLLLLHFSLNTGGQPPFDMCGVVLKGDCEAAIRSEFAVQLGIPLAGWALVHYAMVAVSVGMAIGLRDAFRQVGMVVAFSLSLLAAIAGLVLGGMILTGSVTYCPLCLVVHVTNIAFVPLLLIASGQRWAEMLTNLREGARYLVGGEVNDAEAARWRVVGVMVVLLVGVVTYQWVLIQADRHALDVDRPLTIAEVIAEWESTEARDLGVKADDARLGSESAPVQMVVFSDFECPACARFAGEIMHVRDHYPKQLSVVFKHYPLSSQCNSGVDEDLHPNSCRAALAAEAARRQGKFWEYHDKLFATEAKITDELLTQFATELKLDVEQFQQDISDPAVAKKIGVDTDLGTGLDLSGTPTAFLNGKELSPDAMGMLEGLVDHLIEH